MPNAYISIGHGPHRVLALHGWFGSARGWGSMVDVLDRERFTYVFMDYRGYGGSKGAAGKFTIDEIAADAIALADSLRWDSFSLIGHSMGGKAIQRVLVEAPARVKKLVAVTPVPAAAVPFDDAGWGLFTSAATSADARRGIIGFSTGNRLSATWINAVAKHSLDNSTEEAFAAYLLAWAKTDFAARVQGLTTPVKVIVGEHDPAITADIMRATYLVNYPNATLETMTNAGHYPMDETPVALATSIEAFLAG
jgi:pimeloyl-ACP methyl ester carboxylesterase